MHRQQKIHANLTVDYTTHQQAANDGLCYLLTLNFCSRKQLNSPSRYLIGFILLRVTACKLLPQPHAGVDAPVEGFRAWTPGPLVFSFSSMLGNVISMLLTTRIAFV
jgi:hypothetical protein